MNEYVISLPSYPKLVKISPFNKWVESEPTKSLTWYDSYNNVKHDRVRSENKASLENVINAVAAIHILLEAQYGREIFDINYGVNCENLFRTIRSPIFGINEIEFPKMSVHESFVWDAKENYPLSNSRALS